MRTMLTKATARVGVAIAVACIATVVAVALTSERERGPTSHEPIIGAAVDGDTAATSTWRAATAGPSIAVDARSARLPRPLRRSRPLTRVAAAAAPTTFRGAVHGHPPATVDATIAVSAPLRL